MADVMGSSNKVLANLIQSYMIHQKTLNPKLKPPAKPGFKFLLEVADMVGLSYLIISPF